MTGHRLILFDVDGTLIDSQLQILAAMEYAFGAGGQVMPDRASVLSIVGLSLPEAMAALAPHLTLAETSALAGHYRDAYGVHASRVAAPAPLYPGARAALDRLSQAPRTTLGIATGKARRGLRGVFEAHDLAGYFATAQTSDAHPSKPHPSMVLQALAETGCSAENSVMIGDTEFDIAMGRAAGIATIGVCWGYHASDRLREAGADRMIDHFDGLDDAINGVFGGAA